MPCRMNWGSSLRGCDESWLLGAGPVRARVPLAKLRVALNEQRSSKT
jgi:hypothetical protein